MKTIEQIFEGQRPVDDIIKDLKVKRIPGNIKIREWENDLEKEYDPTKHKVFDKNYYPDIEVFDKVRDEDGNPELDTLGQPKVRFKGFKPVTRVALAMQMDAVDKMAEQMFTNQVKLTYEGGKEDVVKTEQFAALRKILNKIRWDELNSKICTILESQCEVAMYTYIEDAEPHNTYSFPSKFKQKYQLFYPSNGDELYPYFDEYDDLKAFGRQTSFKDVDGKTTFIFDLWTADYYRRYEKTDGSEWVEGPAVENKLGKIPIVYWFKSQPLWFKADGCKTDDNGNKGGGLIHEWEMTLCRNGEVIRNNVAPNILFTGNITNPPGTDSAAKVFVGDVGSDVKVASWNQAPESVRLQLEEYRKLFWGLLGLADLSLEAQKGLGSNSGESRKQLLTGSHLKIGRESAQYLENIDRQMSLFKAFLGIMKPEWNKSITDLEITAQIRPYTIDSKLDNATYAKDTAGILSHQTILEELGIEDVDEEMERLKKEEAAKVEPTQP